MWSLVYVGHTPNASADSPQTAEHGVHLLCGKDYVVGRKNVDILLADDPSISRKHAVLSVKHDEQQLNKPSSLPTLSIADHSKFGTSVRGNKLSGGTCTLSDGDEVKFGQLQNIYRAQYKPLRVTVSSLPSADKVKLKQCLLQLGGHQVNEANGDVDMLLMGKVAVTVKAVCALASLKPIVTIGYLDALLSAIQNKTALPSTNSFTPVLAEEGADKCLLQPKPQRQTLFKGKTFFFCSKSQFDKMKATVQLAGGSALLLESKPRSLSQLTADGCILMYCDANQQPTWYKDCSTYLTRRNKRYIQDAEIGHAVLHCSTDQHCNPEQEAGSRLHEEFSQKMSNTQTMTQTQPKHSKKTEGSMLPPTQAISGATSVLVADSQCPISSKAAERSVHVADMFPTPQITSVPETQRSLSHTNNTGVKPEIKSEPVTPSVKRKGEMDTSKPGKRNKVSNDPAVNKQSKDTAQGPTQDTQQRMDNSIYNISVREDSTMPSMREDSTMRSMKEGSTMPNMREDSTMPSMRDVPTPSKSNISAQGSVGCDVSVVEETQSSGGSTRQPANKPVAVKTEARDRLEPLPTISSTHGELSEERKVEVGESWDRIQVDYACLLRKKKPLVHEQSEVPERQGMALWKGKWVPNFKRFKKCGRRDNNRLPTIIGGGDLVDGLCSQTNSHDDFLTMEPQEPMRTAEVIAPQIVPKKTTIKSSIFGGQWELPSKK